MQTALLSYFPGMYYYMDPTYVLVIIGAVICNAGICQRRRHLISTVDIIANVV